MSGAPSGPAPVRNAQLTRTIVRYAVPLAIIAVLSVYLAVRNRDRVLYELPQLAVIPLAEVQRIELQQGDRQVELRKEGSGDEVQWLIEPQDYPASVPAVNQMVRTVANIKVTDLVSEQSAYSRFELDPDSALRATLRGEDGVLRVLELGKEARTYQHTYVKLENDHRVYQAEGDLRGMLPVDGEQLRDKLVLSFDQLSIGRIVARTPTEQLVLRKRPPLEEGGETQWVTESGGEWDTAKVEESLQRLSNLSTFRFAQEQPRGTAVLQLMLVAEDATEYALTVHERAGNSYPAVSSASDYPFLLFVWMVNGFLDAFTTVGAPDD